MHAVDVSLATLNAEAKINANTKTVNVENAMSVAQADAVLAKYGWSESVAFAV